MKKIVSFILIILYLFVIGNCNFVYASGGEAGPGQPTGSTGTGSSGSVWTPTLKPEDYTSKAEGKMGNAKTIVQQIIGTIIQVFRVVGYGMAIIMLIYIAIKYMSAAPEQKADFKQSATGYIVGAFVLFGVATILGIIQNFAGVLTQ